jgi:hypothetical protein
VNAIWARITAEPVLVTALVGAIINLAIAFGAPIADEQKTGIIVVITAVLAMFARSQVTPA